MRLFVTFGARKGAVPASQARPGTTSLTVRELDPLLQVESPCSRDARQRHKLSNLLSAVSTACAIAVRSAASDTSPTAGVDLGDFRSSAVRIVPLTSSTSSPHFLSGVKVAIAIARFFGWRFMRLRHRWTEEQVCRTRLDKRGRSSSPRNGRARHQTRSFSIQEERLGGEHGV